MDNRPNLFLEQAISFTVYCLFHIFLLSRILERGFECFFVASLTTRCRSQRAVCVMLQFSMLSTKLSGSESARSEPLDREITKSTSDWTDATIVLIWHFSFPLSVLDSKDLILGCKGSSRIASTLTCGLHSFPIPHSIFSFHATEYLDPHSRSYSPRQFRETRCKTRKLLPGIMELTTSHHMRQFYLDKGKVYVIYLIAHAFQGPLPLGLS
jgi:hypothetical protein